jgi:hypothetical protein
MPPSQQETAAAAAAAAADADADLARREQEREDVKAINNALLDRVTIELMSRKGEDARKARGK